MLRFTRSGALEAFRYCAQPRHLRWTLRVALVMGVIYSAINQADLILNGDANALLIVKLPLNFLAPFVVANIGLLGARRDKGGDAV